MIRVVVDSSWKRPGSRLFARLARQGMRFQAHLWARPRQQLWCASLSPGSGDSAAGGTVREVAGGQRRILVIDDDRTVCAVTERVLTSFGFEALTTTDADEGVSLFQDQAASIACTLLDVTMPGQGVEATLDAIRRAGPGTPVVLISGHDARDVAARFPAGTIAGVLQKPFAPETLRSLLEGVLGRPM